MVARIALVTHSLGGGVGTVVDFLRQVISRNPQYEADVIMLSTSMRDSNSVRLMAPHTWRAGIQITQEKLNAQHQWHVGAVLTEFEFQRYRPRPALTALLNQYDLIQVVAGSPAWAGPTLVAARPVTLFAATLMRNERVATIRGLRGWRKAWVRLMTRLTSQIERQALGGVACVFAESDYTRELYRPFTPAERLVLGPPGVDTDYFCPPNEYCADGYILSVGRFTDPRKNVRLLLSAYQRLRTMMPRAPRLVLAGRTGITAEDYAFASRLGLADHLDVRQDLSGLDLQSVYQQAALFVLSSDEEGLGIVILEAMASGLPVISTNCGGPSMAITHGVNGLLTPVGDAKQLAEAMKQLLTQPEQRRVIGATGRSMVEATFSLDIAGRTYLDRYERLLAR